MVGDLVSFGLLKHIETMKYKSLLLLAVCLLALGVNAEVLTPAQSLERVTDVARSIDVRRMVSVAERMEPSATITLNSFPEVYVYTPASGGLLVVSADSETQPLLGYSDNFKAGDKLPPALEFMMECWAEEINAMRSGNVTYTFAPESDFASIAPMCKTKWNQSAPYNNDCPTDANGRSVTGCVATAMAQVLRVYEHPVKCVGGEYSYDWAKGGKTLTLNFDDISFDWSKMKDSYTSTEAAPEVAKLMYALGVASQMNYSSSASGTLGIRMAQALARNFNFDNSLSYVQREWYTQREWQQMIYNELASGKPVYYDGANPDNTSAHAFVVDGYQSDGFFHLNWGWGGMSDGYFRLTALDPSAQGIGGSNAGYNRSQGAIINVKAPAETSAEDCPLVFFTQDYVNCAVEEAPLNSQVQFQVADGNTGIYSGTCIAIPQFKLAMMFENIETKDTIYTNVDAIYKDMQPYTGAWGRVPVVMSKTKFPVGKYNAQIAVYNPNNKKYYLVHVPVGIGRSVNFEVKSDDIIYFSNPETANVKCVAVNVPEKVYAGLPFTMSADFTNDSDEPYYGAVKVNLYGSESATKLGNFVLEMDPNEKVTKSCTLTVPSTISEGNYYVKVLEDNGTELSDSIPIYVNANVVITKPRATSIKVTNNSRDQLTFTMDVGVTSGVYAGPMYAALVNYGQTSVIATQPSRTILVDGSKTEKVEIVMNFGSGVIGNRYTVYPFYKDGNYLRQATGSAVTFTLGGDTSGIENVEMAEDSKVEMFDINGLPVTNPSKGLYIIRQGNIVTKLLK